MKHDNKNPNEYWGEIPEDDMNKLLEDTRKKGWRKGVALLSKKYPEKKRFFERIIKGNESRWRWLKYLDLNENSNILDFGCGMGAISHKLATISDNVYSIDIVKKRLDFTQMRITQDKLNVTPYHIKWKDIKTNNFYDAIICMGVLEWMPIMEKSDKPRRTQLDVLKRFFSALKKDGNFLIGIENRFSYDYFIGKTQHDDIPFTPILPRWISNIVYKILRGKIYQTYTYSYHALKKLLRDAGFSNIVVYVSYPTYQNSKYIYDPEDKEDVRRVFKMLNNEGLIRKVRNMMFYILNVLGIYKHFASHFVVNSVKR